MSSGELPRADDPNVFLAIADVEELKEQWKSNSAEWSGPFSLETYLRREELLVNQELTKDGGLVPWILVHRPDPDGPRRILAGCESIHKKAIMVRGGKETLVLSNGVASVFCSNDFRGRGYAGRMMSELAKRLEVEQFPQPDGGPTKTQFSVLYSDIGKKFYAQRGWQTFPSAHIHLTPNARPAGEEAQAVQLLQASDVPSYAKDDESLLRRRLLQIDNDRTTVAVLPDTRTIEWLQVRAKFFAKELFNKEVVNVGAVAQTQDGRRAWCYWQQNWSKAEVDKDNKLYILRIVSEHAAGDDLSPATDDKTHNLNEPAVQAVAALLRAAQKEAADWGLSSVEFWNPTSLQLTAARAIDPNATIEHRETSSIAQLQWYGTEPWESVDWVANERYAWN